MLKTADYNLGRFQAVSRELADIGLGAGHLELANDLSRLATLYATHTSELAPDRRLSLGIIGMVVTAVGLLFAFSMITEGGPHDEVPTLELRIGVIGFPPVSAGVAAGLIQLARRLRR